MKLDFLLFGSTSSIIGLLGSRVESTTPGNIFFDTFIQCRNILDLTWSVVNISPVADVVSLSDKAALLQTTTITGQKLTQRRAIASETLVLISNLSNPRTLCFWEQFQGRIT